MEQLEHSQTLLECSTVVIDPLYPPWVSRGLNGLKFTNHGAIGTFANPVGMFIRPFGTVSRPIVLNWELIRTFGGCFQ